MRCGNCGEPVCAAPQTETLQCDEQRAERAVEAADALPAALDEIERLRSAQAKAMCTWCGFEASGDNRAKIIVDHIESCASVPWNLVEENERLRKIITDAGLDPDAGRAEKMAGDE